MEPGYANFDRLSSNPMIDSHAHLAEEAYDEDRVEVLKRASEAGIDSVIVIGYDVSSCYRAIKVVRELAVEKSQKRDGVPGSRRRGISKFHGVQLFATVGVAPHHVLETNENDLAEVRGMLGEDVVVAVGEIGLDYHYDMPPDKQLELFAHQLEWAAEFQLPVVIHSREAEDDVLSSLREQKCSRGVIHCFTEGPNMARSAVELGLHVSFAGILTFKNADELRGIAAEVPLERILIETDSPFLAPVPYRGKRNEPAFVVEVARTIAELHGISLEEVGRITAENARKLFLLPE
ncbi:MAG: TatD family hydrolase [Acidobacteriota bacterium]|nr:TatD family hydrolase [Acidobacteriota bacterium]